MKKFKVTAIESHVIEWDIIEAEDMDNAIDIANNDYNSSECTAVEVVEMYAEEIEE